MSRTLTAATATGTVTVTAIATATAECVMGPPAACGQSNRWCWQHGFAHVEPMLADHQTAAVGGCAVSGYV